MLKKFFTFLTSHPTYSPKQHFLNLERAWTPAHHHFETFTSPSPLKVDSTHFIVSIIIVLIFLKGSDLYELLLDCQYLLEPDVAEITRQLLCALIYLHSQLIVHRDIKVENIFVSGCSTHVLAYTRMLMQIVPRQCPIYKSFCSDNTQWDNQTNARFTLKFNLI